MKSIILASTSPRRQEILGILGLPFKSVSSDYEENMKMDLKPLDLAKHLSLGKAQAVAQSYAQHLIIAADTFIALEDELLGKPHTAENARKMLQKINGKNLRVITGYAIIDTSTGKIESKAVVTEVKIKILSESEIDAYVKTGEPLDKAGAFAIQGLGAVIVERIAGDFFNVMGLPVYELVESLKKFEVLILK